jgi:hypothetical protein
MIEAITPQDVYQMCKQYDIAPNKKLLEDLPLFACATKIGRGKNLLLLNLCYRCKVDYQSLLKFNLVGNGNSSKRHLKAIGFIFKDIGSGRCKDLYCKQFTHLKQCARIDLSQHLKKALLEQIDYCEWCGSKSKLEIDHRLPICRGKTILPFSLNNVHSKFQVLCNRCNSLKRERCLYCCKTGIIINRPDFDYCHNTKVVYDGTCQGCYYYNYKGDFLDLSLSLNDKIKSLQAIIDNELNTNIK